MGTFQLGALLGANQSFEDFETLPTSWLSLSDQASFFQTESPSQVHSSAFGLRVFADSTGGSAHIARYDYGLPQDAHRIWYPEVDTHALVSWVWARAADAPSSGQLRWRLGGDQESFSPAFAFTGSLQRYQASVFVQSGAGVPLAGPSRVTAANSRCTGEMDDVLTQVDLLTVYPDWSLLTRERATALQHRTREGLLQRFRWSSAFEFQLPLRWLSSSEAGMLNWWWEGQMNLAFTLDTSDTESVFICRIVKPSQPVGKRMRPYPDRWAGRLELAGINPGGLKF